MQNNSIINIIHYFIIIHNFNDISQCTVLLFLIFSIIIII